MSQQPEQGETTVHDITGKNVNHSSTVKTVALCRLKTRSQFDRLRYIFHKSTQRDSVKDRYHAIANKQIVRIPEFNGIRISLQ